MANARIEKLQAELRAAREEEKAAREQKLLDTPVLYRYEVLPAESRTHFDKLYDETCVVYRITRTVLNMDEAKAVGHHEWDLSQGGMEYIYNTVTTRVIGGRGGGTAYITSNWNGPSDGADDIAFSRIGLFLVDHPEGGDITHIVKDYQAARKA